MKAEGAPAKGVAGRVATAAMLIGWALVGAAGGVGAAPASSPQTAYWWQPEPVNGLIPVPGVPSNGLYVASSPTGPQAESAVRFNGSGGTTFVRLTLHVSMQEHVGKPAVLSFPATSRWQTGGPQPWSARPSYRARARPTRGIFSHSGSIMTLTFPASEAAAGIVLVPDPHAANQSFTIAFAPPHSADITFRTTATNSPSASPSSGSHHPTHTPGGPHSGSPSARPSHPGHSPTPTRSTSTTASPSASPTTSPTTPPPAAASASTHTGRDVLIGAGALVAVLLTLFWVFRSERRAGS